MRLDCVDLSKKYHHIQALTHFNATFTAGIYALLGPNGSGKTTLMNLLSTNLKPDTGAITFNNTDIHVLGNEYLSNVGYAPQTPGLYANFTIKQFLWYMASVKDSFSDIRGKKRKEKIQEAIDSILLALDLKDIQSRKISTLSGGMKQRVAIAQAVLGDARILLLDEPTAGLDPKQRILVRNYLSEIAINRIIIISTHLVHDVSDISQEILLLKKGVLIKQGSSSQLCEEIVGKVWEQQLPSQDLAEFQKEHSITRISHQSDGDGLIVRYLSEQPASALSVPVTPELEDVYFLLMGLKSDDEKEGSKDGP